MPTCPRCGEENPERARFCLACGAPVAEAAPAREQRKVVTVLFCDVTGSTELGERLDPEALRALLAGYFERMKAIVERHGGSVEKFIGDAVMAVFGVPVVHEDDALRAVRAAVEMREALPELGVEGRIGVATGEVVTGTQERLATGDAVNVAARLQQAAQPGAVLIGAETYGLVRDAARVASVEPLRLKGKAEPVVAYRLLSLEGEEGFVRHLDAPMVGRETELRRLHDAFEQAVHDRSCQLFTLLGAAGVGKSRLAAEFLASLGDALVVRGRCLPYGEGITYWPVAEVVKQLPPVEVDPAVAATIEAVAGDGQVVTSSEEIAWAFRKLLEAVAESRPLVCVFDDAHWGEETFLDLVEHVADLSRDAPVLLLTMARPDLLDRRPGWAGGKVNATNVLLEPLGVAETERLIESLAHLDEGLRDRIREAAEGNPLFVEEMVAMVRESPGEKIVVPPTIQALLAARLDQLERPERSVLERGAVEGRVFHRGAVQALAPDEPQVTARLTSLVRKELVRPDRPQLPGEDAFRFRHLLIRDAAYDALPKAIRAELHERFAVWLEENGPALVEQDEILGHHLELAHRYRAELGLLGDAGDALARRAAQRLAAAGRRAAGIRGDMAAAANLLGRASALLPAADPERLRLQPELALALIEGGELAYADSLLQETIDAAREAADEATGARARQSLALLRLQTDPTHDQESTQAETERLIAVFERVGDDWGLAQAWCDLGKLRLWQGRSEAAMEALSRSLDFAESAGDRRLRRRALVWLVLTYAFGALPAREGLRKVAEIRRDPDAGGDVEAMALISEGAFEAMQGRFAEARRKMAEGRTRYRELGFGLDWAGSAMFVGRLELMADDPVGAERALREGYEELERLGETGYLSTVVAILAEATRVQGRLDEAVRLTEVSEWAASPDDVESQSGWRIVRAQAMAERGALAEAERLAREAVALLTSADLLVVRADAHGALAAVLRLAGRTREAAEELREALGLYERKGDVVSAEKTRTLLGEAAPPAAPTGPSRSSSA